MRRITLSLLGLAIGGLALVAAYVSLMPRSASAKPPGGGGKCGDCPCQDEIVLSDGTVCWLESCHLLDRKNCLWDCHYVCPFPG